MFISVLCNLCCLTLCPVSVKLQSDCSPPWRPSHSSWHQTIPVSPRALKSQTLSERNQNRLPFVIQSQGGLGLDRWGSAPAFPWSGRLGRAAAPQTAQHFAGAPAVSEWAQYRTEPLWETGLRNNGAAKETAETLSPKSRHCREGEHSSNKSILCFQPKSKRKKKPLTISGAGSFA